MTPLDANAFAGMLHQITGGDTALCGELTSEVESDVACQYANDGECDEPTLCAEVSGTIVSRQQRANAQDFAKMVCCLSD